MSNMLESHLISATGILAEFNDGSTKDVPYELIQKSYKTELNPNNKQITLFKKFSGCCRFVYNWGLEQRIKLYEKDKKYINSDKQSLELTKLKQELPWLSEVSAFILQQSLRDLDNAYKNFFERVRDPNCKKKGHPKFKSKKTGYGSFRFISNEIHIHADKIKLPRIGWVALKEKWYLPAIKDCKIGNVTISEKAGRWYVSVKVEERIKPFKNNNGPIIGIDLGLTSFITDNDGNKVPAPKPLNKALKRVKKIQRRYSRKQKGSKNQEKARLKLAKIHQHITNQRKDFLHQLTTELTKTKSVIVIEDLKVSNMVKNQNLAKYIGDVGWYEFKRQLEYKSRLYGSQIIKVPTNYPSTKLCSNCGCKKKTMDLSERTYECLMCDMILDRDINAAKNILNYYLKQQNTVGSTEIKACGEGLNSTKQELDIKSVH